MQTCPKRMVFGPCGGVDPDGSCEVSPDPCVFLDLPTVRWPAPAASAPAAAASDLSRCGTFVAPRPEKGAAPRDGAPAARAARAAPAAPATPASNPGADRMRMVLAQRQIVVGDFPARALDAGSITEVAQRLAGAVDVVLAGDSPAERVQFPPAYRAALIQDAGLDVWTGLNCRDRNRVALEGELAALAHAQVAGVHCVTGDHTAIGGRPDAEPVFDLDSTRLAALARASGHLVAVAESPASPPLGRRAERVAEKARAGAEVCFVNHAGGAAPVARFIREAQDAGARLAYIPCVPLVVDAASAALLGTFTNLVLPDGFLQGILRSADPFAAGVAAAVELSREFLALDGVRGVNLSGGAGPEHALLFAEALAAVGSELAL